MNAIMGEKISIITYKAQTTRHRIMGIMNGEDFQVVYSDTPGIVKPAYKLHNSMMSVINEALEDADIFLLVIDVKDRRQPEEHIIEKMKRSGKPVIIVLNKMDLIKKELMFPMAADWSKRMPGAEIVPVSSTKGKNVDTVLNLVLEKLPEHPGYFDKVEFTTRTMRFFVSEMIREKIFLCLEKEIPYASEVIIDSYKEEAGIDRIAATIYVERDTQKSIMIGKGGSMLKKIGTEARLDMEEFLGKKVFLELFVKVNKDWRNNANKLKNFGY